MTDPEQVKRDAELQVLSQFAGAPGPTQAPSPGEDMRERLQNFDGDYNAFRDFVMANAESILGE
jgi:hypothetical protein